MSFLWYYCDAKATKERVSNARVNKPSRHRESGFGVTGYKARTENHS